jgi:hypothetical protein
MRCQATVSSIFFLFPAWERRIVGGKGNTRGTPQGGVASPLLASIYMNRFL